MPSSASSPEAIISLEAFQALVQTQGGGTTGIYSRFTFLTLYRCLLKLVVEHGMKGLILSDPGPHPDFQDTLKQALPGPDTVTETLHQTLQWIDTRSIEGPPVFADGGYLIILTDRLCASVIWRSERRHEFPHSSMGRRLQGGWNFHPQVCRELGESVHTQLHLSPSGWADIYTHLDRRFDEKLGILISSLVQGLETQNIALADALETVHELNQRAVDQERLAAIGQLCSVIAHEIRNPLGLIELYTKIVETQITAALSPETQNSPDTASSIQSNIQLIRSSVQSLEGILSDLSSYAKPLQLQVAPENILTLIHDWVKSYQPVFEAEGKTLTWGVPEISPDRLENNTLIVSVDAERLKQAMINLLKNALEATPEGKHVIVTIASRNRDDKLYVKVKDQGSGVDPFVAPKLFTPYFSTKKNGSGLGLAHSRKILQAHGGSVDLLSSDTALGSTFALILPLK